MLLLAGEASGPISTEPTVKKKRDKEKNQMKYYTIIEERGGERIIKYMDVLDTRTIDRGY